MSLVKINTATTNRPAKVRGSNPSRKVYQPVVFGQISRWTKGVVLLVLLGLPPLETMLTNPVLYAANRPLVRNHFRFQRTAYPSRLSTADDKDTWLKSLQATLSVQWQQIDLQQIVAQSSWPGVTLWCDRRVDTSQLVDLEIQAQPLHEVVRKLAEQCRIGVVFHDGIIALLPKDQSDALPVVLADARRQAAELPTGQGQIWLARETRSWPRLAQPNELLGQWVERIPNLETIDKLPHDVWDAGKIPALPLIEQVAILAFGFGLRPVLTVTDAKSSLRFEPLRADTICQISIEDTALRTEFRKMRTDFTQRYPTLSANFENVPQVSGPVSELGVLLATLQAKRASPETTKGESRYTIKLEGQPAETVIRFLAQQIKRDVTFETDVPKENLSKPIKLDADQWTLEELFRQIGQQSELDIQVDATRILVRSRSDQP
ncbi:MAG: hypothetical protein JNL67_07740 [Planctomycetaceae bacterium]|nr:hypothetical protein [Planctomycetaceae bacterium]